MATAADVTGNTDDPFWQAALQQFDASHRPPPPKEGLAHKLGRQEKLDKIEFFNEFMRDQSSVQQARKACMDIKASANDQYTNQAVNLILGNLNYVIAAGDMAFKGGAETVAMAWSGIKFIMLAVQADKANCMQWAAAGSAISTILVACRTLGNLYRSPAGAPSTDASGEVTSKLTPIYATILSFSYAAKRQLERSNKVQRMIGQFNPFSSAGECSTAQLEGIKSMAKDIRDASQVAFQEWSKQAAKESTALTSGVKDDVKSFQTLFLKLQQSQDALLSSMDGKLDKLGSDLQEQKGMIEKMAQSFGVKTPYELDIARFDLNKKLLAPQEDYRNAAFTSKVKIHDQRPFTCKWIFQEDEFKDWRDSSLSESSEKGLLWLSGGPGYGKSILMTHVIETLKEQYAVSYFYCSRIDSSDGTRSTVRIKQDIVFQLYQLTRDDPHLLEEANRIFAKPANSKKTKGKTNLSDTSSQNASASQSGQLPDMDEAFIGLAGILNRKIFLIVDALDECVDRKDEEIVATLKSWAANEKTLVRVLISSRREPDLVEALSMETPTPNLKAEDHNSTDIRTHTDGELSKIPALSARERSDVSQAVVDRAQGQFTYINLALNILKKPFVRPIENLIRKLAANNRSMNQETLKRLDPAYYDLAKCALQCTLLRQGEITVGEIMDIFTGTYTSGNITEQVQEQSTSADVAETEQVRALDAEVDSAVLKSTDDTSKAQDAEVRQDLSSEGQTKTEPSEKLSEERKPTPDGGEEQEPAENSQQETQPEEDAEEEDMDLYLDQIVTAAGPFLDITSKPDHFVVENHPSVRESFRATDDWHPHPSGKDGACETCKRPHDIDREFLVDPKWGHIVMATQALIHLNNTQFQERYLIPPSSSKVEEDEDEANDAENEASEEGADEANDAENEASVEGADAAKETAKESTEGSEAATPADSAVGIEESNTDAIIANGETGHGVNGESADAGAKIADQEHGASPDEDPKTESVNGEEDAGNEPAVDGEGEKTEVEEAPEEDDADSELDDGDADMDKDAAEEAKDSAPTEKAVHQRYEIFAWERHLIEAEKLWGWDTRNIDFFNLDTCEKEWYSADEDTKELWTELKNQFIEFFYGENGGYKAWFLKVYENSSVISGSGVYFTPLQFAAMYGLASLAVMLCEHGDSIDAKDELAEVIPLYFCRYSPSFNEDANMVRFFAGQSTNESAAAEMCRKIAGDRMTPDHTLGQELMFSKPKADFDSSTCFASFFENADPDVAMAETLLHVAGKGDQWDAETKRNILHTVASYSTYPGVVETLVRLGELDINTPYLDGYKQTPLHLLLYRVDLPEDMLDAFLNIKGIDVNAEDADSEMPLIGACRRGHLAAAKKLVAKKADIRDLDNDGQTAISIACYFGNIEIIELLVENKAELLSARNDGRSPLYLACWNGKEKAALRILEFVRDYPIEQVDQAAKNGRTPLRKASWKGMTDVVKLMLAMPGAEERLSITDKITGRTPLHVAAARGHAAIVKILLEHNVDVKLKDKNDKTALRLSFEGWALSFGGQYEETILHLLDKDPALVTTIVDDSDPTMTLVHVAAAKGSTKVLSRLMKLKVSPSTKDRHGWTPLLLARQSKHYEAVNLLESFGAESGNHPRCLNIVKTGYVEVSDDGRSALGISERSSVLSNHPIPADVGALFYFEVMVESFDGPDDCNVVAIGLCSDVHTESIDGWLPGHFRKGVRSYAYHCDDGQVYDSTQATTRKPAVSAIALPTWGEKGRVVGCGLHVGAGTLFFTQNGERLDTPCKDVSGRLFPIVGVEQGAKASINFGDQSEFMYKEANVTRKT